MFRFFCFCTLATPGMLIFGATTSAAIPNIVVIMADDMGYGDASCYGGKIKTPQIDRMALAGIRMTDFHSSGVVCSPTRAGLLTGRYQQRAGIPGVINADPKLEAHHRGLMTSEVTFSEVLKKAGYRTAIFGKWHLGYSKKFNPMYHGFDKFRGFVSGNIDYHSHYDRMDKYDWWDGLNHVQEKGYSTHLITKHAVRFIEENKDKPFCLYVAHEAVHSPWQGPHDPAQRGPNRVKQRPDKRRAFREMLVELDRSVGEIRNAIEKQGLSERTLIVFFSDNGPAGGSAGPLRGRKGTVWEGGHRVPAIACWPGKITPGSVCHELTISLDLMPTMLALAGAKAPENHKFDGINLWPIWTNSANSEKAKLGDRKLYWNGRAMRDGPWKLVRGGRGARDKLGLYNLAEDIGEQKNLAKQHPKRVAKMLADLKAWKKDVEMGATQQTGRSK